MLELTAFNFSTANLGYVTIVNFETFRRKRQHTNSDNKQRNSNSTEKERKVQRNIASKQTAETYSEYSEKHKKNYSSHIKRGGADEINGDCSSPYDDTEGDYDHLRGTKSRQKEVDDTYNHALPVPFGDSSYYDVTRRKCDQETDNTYDKTGGNNFDSEYGYTSNKVLLSDEESPYDKTSTTLQI
jgi:hypothetical protein